MSLDISNDLIQLGLTKELLLFFHSRTANSRLEIEKAFLEKYRGKPNPGEPIIFKVRFVSTKVIGYTPNSSEAEYTIDISKLRQKRINLLLNGK